MRHTEMNILIENVDKKRLSKQKIPTSKIFDEQVVLRPGNEMPTQFFSLAQHFVRLLFQDSRLQTNSVDFERVFSVGEFLVRDSGRINSGKMHINGKCNNAIVWKCHQNLRFLFSKTLVFSFPTKLRIFLCIKTSALEKDGCHFVQIVSLLLSNQVSIVSRLRKFS